MTLFALTVTFRLHPGAADAFRSPVRDNARLSVRDEPRCLRFDVCEPEGGDGHEVLLYEVYADATAFAAHLAAPHDLAFDAATRAKVVTRYAATVNG